MRRCLPLLKSLLLSAALTVFAAQAAQPLPQRQEVAAQWFKIRNKSFDHYEALQSGAAAFEGHNGVSIWRTDGAGRNGFNGIGQSSRAEAWRGQRVAMRAWIKTENADAGHLWLRIDAADRILAMDNMDKRVIVGTTGWTLYEIVMDVPVDAATWSYGAFLAGGGRMDIDNVQFAVAPPGTPVSTIYFENRLRVNGYAPPAIVFDAPGNLDFELLPAP